MNSSDVLIVLLVLLVQFVCWERCDVKDTKQIVADESGIKNEQCERQWIDNVHLYKTHVEIRPFEARTN